MTNTIVLIIYFGIGLFSSIGSYKKSNHKDKTNIANIIANISVIFIWPVLIIIAFIIYWRCEEK